MKTVCSVVLVISFIGLTSLEGAVYKGQREYVKKCRSCHGDGQKLLSSKDSMEWEDLMDQNGKALAAVHINDESARDSWDYFGSRKYENRVRDLRDFMLEYASDSGNVPACH